MTPGPAEAAGTGCQRMVLAGRAALAEALDRQDAAERRLAEVERAIHNETLRATHPDTADELVEAFVAWLPGARRRSAEAQDALDYAAAQAAQARTALTMARAAARAATPP